MGGGFRCITVFSLAEAEAVTIAKSGFSEQKCFSFMSLLIMDTLHTVPLKKDTSYKKYASSEVASSFSSGSILCDKKEDLTQSTVDCFKIRLFSPIFLTS